MYCRTRFCLTIEKILFDEGMLPHTTLTGNELWFLFKNTIKQLEVKAWNDPLMEFKNRGRP